MEERQEPIRIESHEAVDRFRKVALRTAHDLTVGLSEAGLGGDEPIVYRTDGPHRSIDGLAALIDSVLADEAPPPAERRGDDERRGERGAPASA